MLVEPERGFGRAQATLCRPELREQVVGGMWPDAWGVRMEHILRNVLMALLEQPDATLHEVLRVFSDMEVTG